MVLRRSATKLQPVSSSVYKYLAQAAPAVGTSEVGCLELRSDALLYYSTALLRMRVWRLSPLVLQTTAKCLPLGSPPACAGAIRRLCMVPWQHQEEKRVVTGLQGGTSWGRVNLNGLAMLPAATSVSFGLSRWAFAERWVTHREMQALGIRGWSLFASGSSTSAPEALGRLSGVPGC